MRKAVFILASLLLLTTVHADVGPKPSAAFHVKLDGVDVQDEHFYAAMLGCDNVTQEKLEEVKNYTRLSHPALWIEEYDDSKLCTWYPATFAWGGDCQNSRCDFTYFLPSDFRLAVYIPSINRTFITPEAKREDFNSKFNVELFSDGRTDIHKTSMTNETITSFIVALVATIIIELIFSFAYIRWRRLQKRILISVVIANLVSVTLLWIALPLFGELSFLLCCFPLVFAEALVVLLECAIIYLLNRKRIKIADAFMMSLINNLTTSMIWVLLIFASMFALF